MCVCVCTKSDLMLLCNFVSLYRSTASSVVSARTDEECDNFSTDEECDN